MSPRTSSPPFLFARPRIAHARQRSVNFAANHDCVKYPDRNAIISPKPPPAGGAVGGQTDLNSPRNPHVPRLGEGVPRSAPPSDLSPTCSRARGTTPYFETFVLCEAVGTTRRHHSSSCDAGLHMLKQDERAPSRPPKGRPQPTRPSREGVRLRREPYPTPSLTLAHLCRKRPTKLVVRRGPDRCRASSL